MAKASTNKASKRTKSPRANETRAAKNRPEALRLKIQGLSYRQIGERLGVSHTVSREYVTAELERSDTTPEERNRLRDVERARLETVLVRMMALATRTDVIIETEKKGPRGPVTISVEDYASATKASDVVVKLSARIAALYGLDAPVKQEHGLVGDFDTVQKIRERLASRGTQ